MAEKLPPATVVREPVAEDNNNEGDDGGWEDFEADNGGDAFAANDDDDDDPLPDPHANDMQVSEAVGTTCCIRSISRFC